MHAPMRCNNTGYPRTRYLQEKPQIRYSEMCCSRYQYAVYATPPESLVCDINYNWKISALFILKLFKHGYDT